MANQQRTERRRYQSLYGGGWISAQQRLAEMACERIAEFQARQPLVPYFWRQKSWLTIFRREATHAAQLLNSFAFAAVTRAWESPRGRTTRTLGAPHFRPLVEVEHQKWLLEQESLKTAPLPESVNTLEKPRPVRRPGQSIREKLDDNAPTQRGFFDDENAKDAKDTR